MEYRTKIRSGLAAVFLIAALAGCGEEGAAVWRYYGGSETPPSIDNSESLVAAVTAMAVRPAYSRLTTGQRVQLSTDLWFSDGALIEDATSAIVWPGEGDGAEDIREDLLWITDNYGIATVDETGLVTALSSGETTIRVRCRDGEGTARIVVTASISHDPNIDITPIP